MRAIAFLILVSAAASSAAEPFLGLPLDCTLGESCFIEDYADIDPGPGDLDYTCGPMARDGHRGTDFALPDLPSMRAGVDVIAAADGVVEATRDGIADRIFHPGDAARIAGRECGNAVRIGHPNGLKTLYCHLERGSVAVSRGDTVQAGDPLGRVGLSGQTTFPHLHFSVLLPDGTAIDPFHVGVTPETCGNSGETLWSVPVPYQPTGFFTAGFATAPPSYADIRSGAARADTAPRDGAVSLYAYVFRAQSGDVMRLSVTDGSGRTLTSTRSIADSAARAAVHAGFAPPDGGWALGTLSGQATLTREGRLIGARQAYIQIRE